MAFLHTWLSCHCGSFNLILRAGAIIMNRVLSKVLPPLFALSILVTPLGAAEVVLEENPGFLPYLTDPAYNLPAGLRLETYNNSGVICGNLLLIPRRTAWGSAYALEAAYRWEGGAWQAGAPWLPSDEWPAYIRQGFLGYLRTDPVTGSYSVDFLDAATGSLLWTTDSWLREPEFFDMNEYALAKPRREGGVEVLPRNGPPLVIPVERGLYQVMLDGREVAILSDSPWPQTTRRLERWSIDSGESLGFWILPPDTRCHGFHRGRAVIGEEVSPYSTQLALLRPGSNVSERIPLPEAAQPGSRILRNDVNERPNPDARTPTGLWVAISGEKEWKGALMHCDLSGEDGPAWTLGIDGDVLRHNGYRVLVTKGWDQPQSIADADPATLPTAFLVPSRSPEISGFLPVKARLDRPSAATVRVRVASRTGGTATPGADYSVFDQWITFPPGTIEAEAALTLTEDFLAEPHETLPLEITAVENANPPAQARAAAVIEASGVQQTLVTYPDVPANPGGMSLEGVTGGDGLAYRVTGPEWPIPHQPGVDTPARNRIEVSDPLTGTVLETITIRLDPRVLPPQNVWFGTNYLPGMPYSAGGSLLLRPSVDGVIARYQQASPTPLEWKISARRTQPAFSIRIATAVEGGAAGLVRLTHLERGSAERTARLDVTEPNLRRIEISSYAPYSPLTPAVVTIPADGSPGDFPLPINPWQWTSRKTPLRLLIHDADDLLVEDAYMEPAPGDYIPASTTLPLDPDLSAGGTGNYIRRGDSLWISFPNAVNPATGRAGCVQEIDAVTYAPKRLIWAPPTLKHRGFGERIIDAGRDLIVLASYIDDRKRKHKVYRTICVIDATTGTYRAVIPWKFWEDPKFAFDDNYLAIASHSYDDGEDRLSGGLSLYSRSTYKLAGSLKFVGRDTGRGIAIAGGSLWVGMPMTAYRPAGLPKNDPGQIGAGAVLRFAALPSLKTYQTVLSPAIRMDDDYFGRSLDVTEDGFVIVGAENGPFRIDPSSQLPTVPVSGATKLLPSSGFSRGNGLRTDFFHAIYDETTGLRLADFYNNGLNAIAGDFFLFNYPGDPLLSVRLDRCGSFELWQRFAPDIPGDSRPDIQRYVEEHLGGLPEVTVTPKYGGTRTTMIIGISSVMPPDTTMMVEYSIAGGPWQLAAIRQGLGPVRDRTGAAVKTQPDQIETPDDLPTTGIRYRARYDMTSAMPLSLQEYRHQYVKP